MASRPLDIVSFTDNAGGLRLSWTTERLQEVPKILRAKDLRGPSQERELEAGGGRTTERRGGERSSTEAALLVLISQLGELSRKFILKRTAAVLNNYLPPKCEFHLENDGPT